MNPFHHIADLHSELTATAVLHSMDCLCSRENTARLTEDQRKVLKSARAAVRNLIARGRLDDARSLVGSTIGFIRISALRASELEDEIQTNG